MPQKKYNDTIVHTFTNSLLDMNTYIVQRKNECIIIDCGSDYLKLIKLIKSLDLKVLCILITHGHFDHIIGTFDLKNEFKCDVFIHKKEQWYLTKKYGNYVKRYFKIDSLKDVETCIMPEKLKIGNFEIETFFVPGHTLFSNSFYFKDINVLFSGDFIFKDTIGRTDFEDSNPKLMDESLEKFIISFDKSLVIYPGHGFSTTLESELRHNVYIKDALKRIK